MPHLRSRRASAEATARDAMAICSLFLVVGCANGPATPDDAPRATDGAQGPDVRRSGQDLDGTIPSPDAADPDASPATSMDAFDAARTDAARIDATTRDAPDAARADAARADAGPVARCVGTPTATNPCWLYRPEDYTGPMRARLTYGGTPLDTTMFHVYSLGSAAANPIPWQVGHFTGYDEPAAVLTTNQLGFDPSSYGTTSFQMYGTHAGFMLNTAQLPAGYAGTGGGHITYHFSARNPALDSPWRRWGANTRVRLQFNATVNHYSSTVPGSTAHPVGCIAYLPAALVLVGPTVTFQWVFGAYNNTLTAATEREYVHQDDGTSLINVNTYFDTGMVYSATASSSTHSNALADDVDRWYGGYLDGSHLANAVAYYNAHRGSGAAASGNPADYAVAFISVGPEWRVYDLTHGLCHYGVSLYDMALIAYVP